MPANFHDITETHNLLLKDDEVVYGDSGYIGVEKRDEIKTDLISTKFVIVA